jgi:transposase
LTAKVEALTKQVEVLTGLLNRNSKNSHLPPSSDGPGSGSREAASAAHNKRKAERKRGGQKGHRGSHRELLPVDRVDTFVDLFPDVCLGCARPLRHTLDAAACRYQQLDVRDHRPHLTEWRRHEVQCEHCSAWTRSAYDSAKIPNSAFGPCLTATVALLTGAYHLIRRKTLTLLSELFGSPSRSAPSARWSSARALRSRPHTTRRYARCSMPGSSTLTPRRGRAPAS